MPKPRVLFLLPGPVPPHREQEKDRFFWLSEHLEGGVLWPVWWADRGHVQDKLGTDGQLEFHRGSFTYRFFLQYAVVPPARKLATFLFYLREGRRFVRRGGKLDAIVCYGTNLPGIAARILKMLTGAKLIVEIPGVPSKAFIYETGRKSWKTDLKRKVADVLLRWVLRGADGIRLLFPEQLAPYPPFAQAKRRAFHEFVPVAALSPQPSNGKPDAPYLLLLGYPWYLKGADLLIKAFHELSRDFPDLKLKIVGYCDDRSPFEELRAGDPRIEFTEGVGYNEAMDLIAKCFALVLASRTEAMGRVLLEGMATKRPLVASAVDGIPYYVRDGENGVLFPPGDVQSLTAALRRVLTDAQLRERISAKGYEVVRAKYGEKQYASEFGELVREVAG